jgi:hypothetical protein
MKKIYILICFLPFIFSCSKFLEQSSQDLIRPTNVSHYKELLQGESYFKYFYTNGWFVDVMTDDIMTIDPQYETSVSNEKAAYCRYAFQWDKDIENPEGTFKDNLFQHLYKNILTANTCLESLEAMTGTDEDKNILRGQASFVRAYAYFILANLYSKPYNEASAEDLCVPLITNTTPSLKSYPRATIEEVWGLISQDIETSVECLSKDTDQRSYYEINYRCALILASRVFLYMEDYSKSILYGEEYIRLYPALKDITSITISPKRSGANTPVSFSIPAENPEIAFTFNPISSMSGSGTYLYYTSSAVAMTDICIGASAGIERALIDTYGTNDRRKTYWFVQPSGSPGTILAYPSYCPAKVSYYDGARFSQNMRTAEVYLNLAEAYSRAETPNTSKALDCLNALRSKRIYQYTNLTGADFSNNTALTQFVWEERRRELCFEEFHRWWDLRRTGQPSLTHTWLSDTYVLEEKDGAYVLNFPKDELEFNKLLVENERPDRAKIN